MANEFIIRKGFKSLQDSQITGSLNLSGDLEVLGSISGDITGSASTASYIELSNVDGSASLASRIFTNSSSIASLETVSGSYANSASFASSISSNSSSLGSLNAVSSSYLLNTTDTLTGDLTVTGNIIATTLNVQDVTASVVYSSGSNVFGSSSIDTQQFTGSIEVSGSIDLQAGDATFAGDVSLISDSKVNLRVTDGTQNIYVGSSGNTRFGLGAGANIIQSTNASFGIGTQDGESFILGANNTAVLTLDTSQNATFASNVTANGIYTAGNSAIIYKAQRNGGAVAGDWSYDDATTDMSIGTSTAHSFSLKTGNTRALTINSSQNATFAGTSNSLVVISRDNMFVDGGQLYIGADDGATDDTFRQAVVSGAYKIESRKSGTWTQRFMINDGGNATFEGDVGMGKLTATKSGTAAVFNSGATNVVATFTSTDGIGVIQCADPTGNVEFGAVGNNFVVQPAGGVAQLTVTTSNSTFAGNVGIGITPNDNSSVVDVLQLGKGMTIMGNVNDDRATMGANLYLDTSTAFRYVMDGYAGRFSIEDGGMLWGLSAIGDAGEVATVTTKMSLSNNGTLTLGGATNTRLVTTITENSIVDLNVVDGTSTARALSFSTAGTARVVIDANGSVYNNSGTGQTFFGSNNAGNPSSVTGTSNSSFGYGAGNALTSGYQNVSVGRDAGGVLTTGLNNVSVGTNAGYNNVDGQQNTYVGTASGYASPGQNYNTFIGYESGHNNTANENTAVGRLSLHSNTTGQYNTAIGMQALANNTTQNSLTALGYRAGYFWTSGEENTFIGYNSGFGSAAASTGGENTLVGSLAGGNTSAISGNGNTSIGRYTLYALTSGNFNTALGHQAGGSISTGLSNTLVGKNAGDSIGAGSRNSILGQSGGQAITTGSDNIAIGYEALYNQISNGQTIAIGVNALYSYTGSRTVAIGYSAAKQLVSDVDNVFIGQDCGHHRISGTDNTFVGAYANYNGNSTGCCNTGFGKSTGYELTSGVQNTFLGRQAGYSVTSADNNTIVGHNAGIFVTGGHNTLIGSGAGDAITTGSHNNIFGFNCEASSVSGTDQIVIGTNGQIGKGNSTGFIAPGTGGVYQGNNSTTWSTTSDKRIKKNIVNNNKGLKIIDKIQVRNFEYRTEEEITDFENPKSAVVNKEGIQLGVIAQEIEKVLPEVVTQESTGVKTVNADNLTWYLINAVKELKAEIEILKNK